MSRDRAILNEVAKVAEVDEHNALPLWEYESEPESEDVHQSKEKKRLKNELAQLHHALQLHNALLYIFYSERNKNRIQYLDECGLLKILGNHDVNNLNTCEDNIIKPIRELLGDEEFRTFSQQAERSAKFKTALSFIIATVAAVICIAAIASLFMIAPPLGALVTSLIIGATAGVSIGFGSIGLFANKKRKAFRTLNDQYQPTTESGVRCTDNFEVEDFFACDYWLAQGK